MRPTWNALLAYLNRSSDATADVFIPDPSVFFLVAEQCRAIKSSTGAVDVNEVIIMLLGSLRVQAQMQAKAASTEAPHRGCMYRLLARLHHPNQPDMSSESTAARVTWEGRLVDLDLGDMNALTAFWTEVDCPVPLLPVSCKKRVQ